MALHPQRVYWAAFGLLGALMVVWALANPIMAAPDENAHVVKAAAVVRGELRGSSAPGNPGSGVVEVPAIVAYSMTVPTCYAFNANATASCIPEPPSDPGAPAQSPTWVVRNNPLYYVLVGLPTLVPGGVEVFYAVRILSALICAAILAWAVRSLAEVHLPQFLTVGLLAALTPMVLFLGSSVNSSSLEISSATALWIALLVLLRSPDPARLTVRMAGVAVLSVLLANSRGLSPFYLGVIALTAIAVSPWRNTVAVLRDRRSWPWLGVIAAGFVGAVSWITLAGTLGAGGSGGLGIPFLPALRTGVAKTPDYIVGMLGHFGWLDTNLPEWAYLLLGLGIGAVVVLALLAHAHRHEAVAVAAVAAMSLGLPVVIQAWQANNVGMIWQGRYSLPLTVGLPIVAGFAARDGVLPTAFRPRSFYFAIAAVLGFVQAVAVAVNLHRYMRGAGRGWFGPFPGEWEPPLPAVLLVVAFVAAYAGLVILLDRVGTKSRLRSEENDAAPAILVGGTS